MLTGLEGQVQIRLNTKTQQVAVQVQRPLAAIQQLLVGSRVEQVLERVPLLFSVCSQAQTYAALQTCQTALKQSAPLALQTTQQQLVTLETQREHVVRLCLDGTAFLGEHPERQFLQHLMRFVPQAQQAWFVAGKALSLDSHLSEQSSTEILQAWQTLITEKVLAMPLDAWAELQTLKQLQVWMDAQITPAARALGQLQAQGLASVGASAYALADELSVLKRQAQLPLIQAALNKFGNGIFTRWLARLVELVYPPLFTHDNVPAARGALRHEVTLQDDRVQSYRIHAPTDYHFAEQGIAAAGLKAILQSAKPESLEQQARLWISAVDPCVAYNLEIQHA